jgi:hypothetical protein
VAEDHACPGSTLTASCESTARLNKPALTLGLPACAVVTPVLFKIFLRGAVEGKRGYRAVEMRCCDTPSAVGTAPTGELVLFDPDQVFVHASTFLCMRVGFELGRGGRDTLLDRARRVDSCPPHSIFHGFAIQQSDQWASSERTMTQRPLTSTFGHGFCLGLSVGSVYDRESKFNLR